MNRMLLVVAASLIVAGSGADAAACRDAKGHFTKCAPAAAIAAPATTKDAKGKCHIAAGPKKGQFTKC